MKLPKADDVLAATLMLTLLVLVGAAITAAVWTFRHPLELP